jgi:hypothetical protein
MTVNVPDRFKAANAFWIGIAKIGLTPAAAILESGNRLAAAFRKRALPELTHC